ncbi:MAG: hypothetical protein ACTSP4_00095 [Candidatus Hodarchaeales archaeon]
MAFKTIAIDEDTKKRFDDYKWKTRSKDSTEALRKLLDNIKLEKEVK